MAPAERTFTVAPLFALADPLPGVNGRPAMLTFERQNPTAR
ncbi:MAG: hypothetical protein AB7U62_17150 [Pseudolabrys sp.]